MQLQDLQQQLQHRYDVAVPYNVNEFFCNDTQTIVNCLGRLPASEEMLLIHEDGDNLDITLFIDQTVMTLIDQTDSSLSSINRHFNEICIAIEGVSHFVYLTWNAGYNKPVKLLEMEIQAEVDKFIVTSANRFSQSEITTLQARLFSNVSYRANLPAEERKRYQQANQMAGHYCSWLARSFTLNQSDKTLHAELARFYRMNGSAKIAHIRKHMH